MNWKMHVLPNRPMCTSDVNGPKFSGPARPGRFKFRPGPARNFFTAARPGPRAESKISARLARKFLKAIGQPHTPQDSQIKQ